MRRKVAAAFATACLDVVEQRTCGYERLRQSANDYRLYLLCIYDASGEKLSAQVPAGRTCGTKPCWKALRTGGFKYADKTGTPEGVTKILPKGGDAGKGKVGVNGIGTNLAFPTLPLSTPVHVQLRQSGSGACWEAIYSTATMTTASEFKAKSD